MPSIYPIRGNYKGCKSAFEICVLLFGLWGVTTSFIFWSAMIKTTRNLASAKEQGRAFGILEGGRNSVDMVTGAILLAVFELGSVFGAAISNATLWIAALAAVVAGFIADKIGPAKAVLGFFILMTSVFLYLRFCPGHQSFYRSC